MGRQDASVTIKVWDAPVRLFHWLLLALVAVSVSTGYIGGNLMRWHVWSGCTILALLICRLLGGFAGRATARFAHFVHGPRAALGLFLTPMSGAYGWGREVFALALAIQVIVWGIAQPFAGAIADRFGSLRVLSGGALLYCAGLTLMAYSKTPGMLDLTAGVLAGLGIAGSSFTIVIAAFSKLMPPHMRSLAFGAGTAAGSFGQFLFSPLAVGFIDWFGWQHALVAFAVITLVIIPLSAAVNTPPMDAGASTGTR